MGVIKKDEIRGYVFDSEIVCKDCVKKGDLEDLKQNEILTGSVVDEEGNQYFCDRCEEEL